MTFFYNYQEEKHPDVTVYLSWYSPGFGGRRYFFLCPHCGRRMRTLHFREGKIACRICHDLTYESCNKSHYFDRLYKRMAIGLDASWKDVRRHINYLTRTAHKEKKRPRGRPRKLLCKWTEKQRAPKADQVFENLYAVR
jgi:hypothetical protein